MRNLLKKLFNKDKKEIAEALTTTESIQKIVSSNTLNKRKNIRISYPHFGAGGPFPKIFYKEREMIVGNISVGGLLIVDDTEFLGSTVGELVNVEMIWPDQKFTVRARVVGATLERRHLQFTDFHPQVFLRVSRLVKPAYHGSQFRRVNDDLGKMNSNELWIGPLNETIHFSKSENLTEYHIGKKTYIFQRGTPVKDKESSEPIPYSLLDDILITLANIPHPTDRIKELVEIVEVELAAFTSKKTGTYG